MSDSKIREVAKQKPLVTLDRVVGEVASVTSDNTTALKRRPSIWLPGVRVITYLAGPEGSGGRNAMAWFASGLPRCRRQGETDRPLDADDARGAVAADEWLQHPTKGVVAYTDLIAIGFIRTVVQAGGRSRRT